MFEKFKKIITNLIKTKNWFSSRSLAISICILIGGLGIAYLAQSSTTTIGEDISTTNINATGNINASSTLYISDIIASATLQAATTTLATTTLSGDLDLNFHQLKDVILETSSTFPSAPPNGQFFWHTTNTKPYWYDGANSRWLSADPVEEVNYIVYQEGVTTSAKNGTTGKIDFSGTDATIVIQNALNALTSGRTWKEKVVVKGNYSSLKQIQIPSYTILEIQGKWTAQNDLNDNLIINSDTINGNTQIEIYGGHVDANKDNQTVGTSAIRLYKVSTSTVHHMIIRGGNRVAESTGVGILVYLSREVLVSDNYTYEADYDNIQVTYSTSTVVTGNQMIAGGNGGIQLAGSAYTVVTGNYIKGSMSSGVGIRMCHEGTINNTIVGNVFVGSSGSTIAIELCDGTNENLVEGNVVYGYWTRGVNFRPIDSTTNRNLIQGNHFSNIATGIRFETNAGDNNQIIDNYIYDQNNAASYVVKIDSGVTNTYIEGNKVYNYDGGWLSDSGTGTILKRNIGYVTENGGAATFSGNGSTVAFNIAHGLSTTPTSYVVTAASSAAKGEYYVTANATNITVTYTTAPASGTNNVVLTWKAEKL